MTRPNCKFKAFVCIILLEVSNPRDLAQKLRCLPHRPQTTPMFLQYQYTVAEEISKHGEDKFSVLNLFSGTRDTRQKTEQADLIKYQVVHMSVLHYV
jgi:hypothetical protein